MKLSGKDIKKHIMTGISFMIPMVVMAGIMGAIQKAFSWSGVDLSEPLVAGLNYSGYSIAKISDFMHMLGEMNGNGFNWAYAFLCAGVAYSISDRPGIVPGFAIGYFAGGPTKTGFLGAMLMGFLIGYFVEWMKSWKMPKALRGLMPVLIIPVVATAVATFVFFGVLMRPIATVMLAFQAWIQSLAEGSLFIVGMTPAIGMGLAAIIAPKKFTRAQKDTAYTCIPMGLCFITEGVLPFVAEDPLRVIPSSMVGSAVASGLAMAWGVNTQAAHGGILVMPLSNNPAMWVLACAIGSVITGVLYAVLKKMPSEEDNKEEEIVDLDIDL